MIHLPEASISLAALALIALSIAATFPSFKKDHQKIDLLELTLPKVKERQERNRNCFFSTFYSNIAVADGSFS